MQVLEVEISSLSPDPANVRRHSERNIETVIGSLRRFGQQIPLVIDAANIVRVGNCRLEGMKRLGWTTAKVIRTELSGSDLAAYAIADNRSGDPEVGSTFDTVALASILTTLRSEDAELFEIAGFTPAELAEMLGKQAADDAIEAPADFPTFDENIPTDHECPKCKYRWSGSTAPAGVE